MKRIFITTSIILIYFLITAQITQAQTQTIGWFKNSTSSYNGYTLFSPIPSNNIYLIDNCGKLIHSWSSSDKPRFAVYLLEDGNILRATGAHNTIFTAGGAGGIIEIIDPNSNVIWSHKISDDTQCQHHDIKMLPNGNILAIVWELKTNSEAIAAGRNPSTLSGDLYSGKIVEIDTASKSISWEWHAWDHLVQDYDNTKDNYNVVADHPELINLNFYRRINVDWLHLNSVDYNAELDQIMISNHNFNEVWIIDHSTTTQEAAGHSGGNSGKGGDLLFRWGNPQAYDHGTGDDEVFYGQHDARWIPSGYPGEGGIMVFNNGLKRPAGNYSTVDVFEPVFDGYNYELNSDSTFLPADLSWQYIAPTPTDFYSPSIAGAERQPNGNTLICSGDNGYFFEVDTQGEIVWEYINPVSTTGPMTQGEIPGGEPPTGHPNRVFRIKRYSPDYPGLQNYDLTPGDPIEINPVNYSCSITTGLTVPEERSDKIFVYPNPSTGIFTISTDHLYSVNVFDMVGKQIFSCITEGNEKRIDLSAYEPGIYFIRFIGDGRCTTIKLIKN